MPSTHRITSPLSGNRNKKFKVNLGHVFVFLGTLLFLLMFLFSSQIGNSTLSHEKTMITTEELVDSFLHGSTPQIDMMMVLDTPEIWNPIKEQLNTTPVYYCGIDNVQPPLPIKYFLDVDEAMTELQSLKDNGAGDEMEVLPVALGNAVEITSMGNGSINASVKNRQFALPGHYLPLTRGDGSPVPMFGIQRLEKSNVDGKIIPRLTDRLYFDGIQAYEMLNGVRYEQTSSDDEFEIFIVTLDKPIDYMIKDKSGFKFEFIPPPSSVEYINAMWKEES